jgi:allantoinase
MDRHIISNLRMLGPSGWEPVDLAIEAGRFSAFAAAGSLEGSARTEGEGAYIFPGGIDLHVHFNEPGRTEWEGFATGSLAAAAGGLTYVADMPLNSIPPTTTVEAFDLKLETVRGQAWVDFGLWGGVVPGNADQLGPLAERGVMGFKAFMTPSGTDEFENADSATLKAAMRRISATGLRLALHAEDPATLQRAADQIAQPESASDWGASRPVEAECVAVAQAIDAARSTDCPIMIVHVSSPEVLELIVAAKKSGVDIVCETCPHYLLLSSEDAETLGATAKCAPPLRSPAEAEGLREQVLAGVINTIGSDHSPCPPALKEGKRFFQAWGGIAGIQHGLPLLIESFGLDQPAQLEILQRAFASRPAEVLGQAGGTVRGSLEVGAPANFFLLQSAPDAGPPRADELLQRHPLSPYLGRPRKHLIRSTWLRGEPVVRQGRPVGRPRGAFVPGAAAAG